MAVEGLERSLTSHLLGIHSHFRPTTFPFSCQCVSPNNVGICKWFISTGSFDSLELFKASLRKFEGKIPHVLVKNLYFRDRWDSVLEQAELKNLLDHYQVKQVDFPKLGFDERDLIDQHKLTFSAALEGSQLSILQKTRVRGFLREIYEAIEATGPVPVASIAGKANTEEKPSE